MLKTIIWAVVLFSAVIVMTARDNEQQDSYKQIIEVCTNSGQCCPKHLREE